MPRPRTWRRHRSRCIGVSRTPCSDRQRVELRVALWRLVSEQGRRSDLTGSVSLAVRGVYSSILNICQYEGLCSGLSFQRTSRQIFVFLFFFPQKSVSHLPSRPRCGLKKHLSFAPGILFCSKEEKCSRPPTDARNMRVFVQKKTDEGLDR